MHPEIPAEVLSPTTGQSSFPMPNLEVDDAGGLGRIYEKREGRDMIRIHSLFFPLSFIFPTDHCTS